ncbi:hypothetical protein AB0H42_01545 [Nocardia sp. NPDC050799]|uniref:hypothetical protein n=1 Tax=Nocardia sp. NPDC050799 TaxID=3154842 RepID=UPI003400414E
MTIRVRSVLMLLGAVATAVTLANAGTAAAQPGGVMPHDGDYLVGVDIVPGIWEAPGTPDPALECAWKRLWRPWTAADDDNPKSRPLLDQHFTRDEHPVRVTIQPTDAAFKTANCGEWHLILPLPTGSSNP